ncbi:MAG: DUF5009 domain-containing protein [Gemmatimonadota bacterium]|nr:DUF5009 domain-containing protein [Gemmatimonadota bacterium]
MTAPSPGRLMSLDAFRGLAVAGMILVNNPGSWSHIYGPLRHAPWHGATPTDLVFPFFLFAVGVSLSFSFAARTARGDSRRDLWTQVVRRALVIYGLGLFMAAFPGFDLATVRLVGVLARIALVYLVAGTLVLCLSRRAVCAVMLALLFGYWALMAWVPVPGFGPGDLSPEGNLAAHLDRMILGVHMWSGGGGVYDPEGLLSTLPAVSTTLSGLFTGDYLRVRRAAGDSGLGPPRHLAAAGAVLVLAGLVWDILFPINKPLWTSSYVLFTTGWALVVLASLYWLIDVRGWRAWARPFLVYGMNAITVFVASGLVAKVLVRWRVPAGSGDATTSLYNRIYEIGFASWAGPLNGSLAFAWATVLLWLAILWVMHARRIFIKV